MFIKTKVVYNGVDTTIIVNSLNLDVLAADGGCVFCYLRGQSGGAALRKYDTHEEAEAVLCDMYKAIDEGRRVYEMPEKGTIKTGV